MDYNKTINIVAKLEEEINTSTETEYFNLVLKSNGFVDIITFLGIRLWCSEDDERELIGEGMEEDYEPLEGYLRRTINNEIKKLQKIKL